MSRLLKLTGVIEGATGLSFVILPSFVVRLLLGAPLDAAPAVVLGRVAGVALLALGLACWLARDDSLSRATRGIVGAMFVYNAGVAAVLVLANFRLGLHGFAWWPAVLLHVVMAVWCVGARLF